MCRASTEQIEVMGKEKQQKFNPNNAECCFTIDIIVSVHRNLMTLLDICIEVGKYTYSPVDVDM